VRQAVADRAEKGMTHATKVPFKVPLILASSEKCYIIQLFKETYWRRERDSTRGAVPRTVVFKTTALNHSATLPLGLRLFRHWFSHKCRNYAEIHVFPKVFPFSND
jgi:hypothetical protein